MSGSPVTPEAGRRPWVLPAVLLGAVAAAAAGVGLWAWSHGAGGAGDAGDAGGDLPSQCGSPMPVLVATDVSDCVAPSRFMTSDAPRALAAAQCDVDASNAKLLTLAQAVRLMGRASDPGELDTLVTKEVTKIDGRTITVERGFFGSASSAAEIMRSDDPDSYVNVACFPADPRGLAGPSLTPAAVKAVVAATRGEPGVDILAVVRQISADADLRGEVVTCDYGNARLSGADMGGMISCDWEGQSSYQTVIKVMPTSPYFSLPAEQSSANTGTDAPSGCTIGVSACAFDNGIRFGLLYATIGKRFGVEPDAVNCDLEPLPPNRVPVGETFYCATDDSLYPTVAVTVLGTAPGFKVAAAPAYGD